MVEKKSSRVFICKQCQKIYIRCNAYAVIEEKQQVIVDEDGLEMVDDSEILNTVTKTYMCRENKYHDLFVYQIFDDLFNMIYNKAKCVEGMPFKVGVEETMETLSLCTKQQLIERLFDEAL